MCVAICCPKGVNTPSLETLKKCWDHNSHGAGFAYNDPHTNRVVFHKGFMKWEDFVHAFQKTCKVDKMTDNVRFIHFRITSKGETCPENTHPFPISDAVNDLKILDGSCNEIMFHNGTFSSMDISEKGISDTMEMAMWVARLKLTSQGLDALCKFLNPFISSNKVGFLNGKGEYALAGNWSEIDGVHYSNTYWNYTQKTYSYNTSAYNYGNKNSKSPYATYTYDYDGYGYGESGDYWRSSFRNEEKEKKDEEIKTSTKELEAKAEEKLVDLKRIIIGDKRVFHIVEDVYDAIDMLDGWCPEVGCNKGNVTYCGKDDLFEGKDPVFYCPDCDKYYVITVSSMSQQDLDELSAYFYECFGFEGTLLEFLDALYEEGEPLERKDITDEEVIETKVTEIIKEEEAKEETKTSTAIIPVGTLFKDIVNKIKGIDK